MGDYTNHLCKKCKGKISLTQYEISTEKGIPLKEQLCMRCEIIDEQIKQVETILNNTKGQYETNKGDIKIEWKRTNIKYKK